MRRGLVIGKFLPIHNGHIALINFAAAHCDELIVSMSRRADDTINAEIRLSWIREIFKNNVRIRAEMIEDDFDDDTLPWEERTKVWARFIASVYPPVDVLVSSEEYGDPLARNLGAVHVPFDPKRNTVPVSATLIRDNPLKYWDYIPGVVRPYFVKKICLYGPESTGKSVMARRFALRYETEYVPEVARELLTTNDFSTKDIVDIGLAHLQRIYEKLSEANKVLFCDTDVITTQIYSMHYLGHVPPVLYELEKAVAYDHYFLFDIDVPWVEDGLRDLGDRRQEMFEVFRRNLDDRNIQYTLVHGAWNEREAIIRSKLFELFDI